MSKYFPTFEEWRQGRETRTPEYSINSIREAELAAGGAGVSNPHRQQRAIELSTREWRTPNYCIREVATPVDWKELFDSVVARLYQQQEFFNVPMQWTPLRKPKPPVQLELFPNE